MRTIHKALLCALLSFASPALAQNVQQSGNVSPGHLPVWITNGVIGDAGTSSSGSITSLGIQAIGPGICQASGPLTGPYQQLCFGVTTTGGQITFGAFGGATPGSLTATINGASYVFPFTAPASGVQGPLSTTVGHGACWNNSGGTLLSDCGAPAVLGPGSTTTGDIAVWNNSSGSALKDTPPLQIFGTQSANLFLAGPTGGGAANPTFRALTSADFPAVTAVTTQSFLSGTGTYTAPAGVVWIEVELQGAGGGGSGSGTGGTGNGNAGNSTCWNTSGSACSSPVYAAGGGAGGIWDASTGGAGGSVSGSGTCFKSIVGGSGSAAFFASIAAVSHPSGVGGSGFSGGAGGAATANTGIAGGANTGGGGSGGGSDNTVNSVSGNGGGAGAYCKAIITSVAGTYTYAVGTGGGAGSAGTSGFVGGNGGTGGIWVTEHYSK